MRRYPAYRDSGIEWLGEVPEGWEVCSLKRVTLSKCDGPFGSGLKSEHYTEDGVRVIRLQNIRSGKFNDADRAFIDRDYATGELQRHEVKARDLLIAGLGDDNNTVGRCCVAPDQIGEAIVKADCFRFRVSEEHALPEFLAYLLNVSSVYDAGSLSSGTTRSRIPLSEMAARKIATPALPEQRAIAAFLDRETAKIDALVAEQRRLIALLAEKRQAVISHAVTRGLNPDARPKPSGIGWLGDVPEGWEVVPLKRLSPAISVGVVVNPSDYVAEEGLPFIYGGDISEGRIDYPNARRISPEASDRLSKSRLSVGDVLTVRVGAPGVSAVVGPEGAGGNCASVVLIRKGSRCPQWLCHAMNSRHVRYQVEVVQYGAAQEQFNVGHAVNFKIVTPSPAEAAEIAAFLDGECEKIDALSVEATTAIALLQERRAALISAAVTGKIDVRDLVPVNVPRETEPA